MKKVVGGALALILVGFTVLVAQAGFKKRAFNGNVTVQVCAKDEAGKWQIVDEMTAPLGFDFNIADVAKNKDLSTPFAFSGRTKKGVSVSARLKNGAIGNSDLASGLVTLDLPLDITVNGKRADALFKLTTESAQGAAGNVSGRRAKIDQAAKSAQLAMVSSATIKDAGVVEQFAPQKKENIADQKKEAASAAQKKEASSAAQKKEDIADQKKEPVSGKRESAASQAGSIAAKKELMIVISGDGLLKSLEK